MRKLKDVNIPQRWQEILYSEAWNQYRHEDDLGVKRIQIFTAVQAGLVAVLALITKPLIGLPPIQVGSHILHIGLILLAAFMLIIGILLLFLGWVLRSVTKSGRCYLNLRWFPIYAIEKFVQLNDINLAGLEDQWRRFFKAKYNRHKRFPIYDDIEELEGQGFELGPLPRFRGWSSIETVTWVFQIISVLFLIAGILLIFLTRAVYIGSVTWPS